MVLVLIGIENDADRNALHYLYVVAGRILRRKKAEAGAAGAADVEHFSAVIAASSVHVYFRWLPGLHVTKLCLLEICRDPDVVDIDDRHKRLPWLNVLADLGSAVPDNTMHRSDDLGVLHIQFGLL